MPPSALSVDLERGQNVLEFGVTRVVLSRSAIAAMGPGEPTTFVSYDFYEHDTELTPLKTGATPAFGTSSQVPVPVLHRPQPRPRGRRVCSVARPAQPPAPRGSILCWSTTRF